MDARKILQHRDVSRANAGLLPGETKPVSQDEIERRAPALRVLVRAKRTNSNRLAARRNAREEAGIAERIEARNGAGAAWEAGYGPHVAPKARHGAYLRKMFTSALELPGLPPELAELIRAELNA